MVFLDKIYFKIYKAYKDKFKDSDPEIYAISYLAVMFSMHVMAIIKFLNLFGVETDTEQYSKLQKIAVITLIYLILGLRYYYFFDPIKFQEKHGFSENYRPMIIYTAVFFVAFWILILAF